MRKKFNSRKFLISTAAFLGSLGTGITGLATGNEKVTAIGAVCMVVSAAIYAACEAYVDAEAAEKKVTTETITTTETSTGIYEESEE